MSELIQEFEKTTTFKYFYSTLLEFDESLNCYVATEKWRNKEAELLTAAWWMFQERQATINQLNSVLNERTKEWIQAIECGTYFENVAKPLRVKNDALQKRIDEALTWLTRTDIRAISMAREILQGGDLKALRGEHE